MTVGYLSFGLWCSLPYSHFALLYPPLWKRAQSKMVSPGLNFRGTDLRELAHFLVHTLVPDLIIIKVQSAVYLKRYLKIKQKD